MKLYYCFFFSEIMPCQVLFRAYFSEKCLCHLYYNGKGSSIKLHTKSNSYNDVQVATLFQIDPSRADNLYCKLYHRDSITF